MGLRPLGRTGLLVSPIGLGTVKFGRNTAVKYPTAFELPGDAAIAALLARASDLGINLLDTAPAYGTAEARLGAALSGQRDRWIIADKAGEEFDGKESRFDFSPSAIVASVERSLKRLRTDRIDVLLLHSDGEDETLARFGPAI
ncbi:MAG TPA: aldo/keto reductase, partial [Candidatus Cybelea sp.]|nr:aldo/keto reductase [Candidatus Cybelea sp.]